MLSHKAQPSCSAPESYLHTGPSELPLLPQSSHGLKHTSRAAVPSLCLGCWCPTGVRKSLFSLAVSHRDSFSCFCRDCYFFLTKFMFVPATAQIKKDRATSQNWLNGGWKMVVNYLLQGKLGEKWGEEWKAESLTFSPAFSWGTAQWHNVQDVLCSCTLQSRSTDPMGILLQGGAPSSTAKGCWVSEHWSINPKIFWAISKQFEWSTKQFQQRGLI